MNSSRMRRAVRALRLVAARLNETDRGDHNPVAIVEDGRAIGHLVDFNSGLGSCNGRRAIACSRECREPVRLIRAPTVREGLAQV